MNRTLILLCSALLLTGCYKAEFEVAQREAAANKVEANASKAEAAQIAQQLKTAEATKTAQAVEIAILSTRLSAVEAALAEKNTQLETNAKAVRGLKIIQEQLIDAQNLTAAIELLESVNPSLLAWDYDVAASGIHGVPPRFSKKIIAWDKSYSAIKAELYRLTMPSGVNEDVAQLATDTREAYRQISGLLYRFLDLLPEEGKPAATEKEISESNAGLRGIGDTMYSLRKRATDITRDLETDYTTARAKSGT